jgi:HK97 family phage prohead protease
MPAANNREYRELAMCVRARESQQTEEMRVHGYATTFNEPYELYRDDKYVVMEQVDPHAFDACDLRDVILQFDHEGRVYARTRNNTLSLSVDEHGLAIEADLSRTDSARQLYEEIRAGMIDRMSYGFVVEEDEWNVKHDRDSGHTEELRTIRKVRKVYDVSAVSIPANDGTSLATRKLCDGVIARHEAERLRAERERMHINLRLRLMEGTK